MPSIDVYNLEKKKVGTVELSEAVFEGDVNEALLYDAVRSQLASRRSGSAKSKGRSEVAGSSRKLFKQKGTGRARHGSIRAPIFVGGGRAHGPKPRDYSYELPKKMRRGALGSALRHKFQEGKLLVVEDLSLKDHKTKALHAILGKLEVTSGALIVDAKGNENLGRSSRNLPRHQYLPPEGVNVYDLLRRDHLVLTKSALEALQERCVIKRNKPVIKGSEAQAAEA